MPNGDAISMMGKRAIDLMTRLGKMQGMRGAARGAISAFTPFARAKGEESFRLKQGELQREFAREEAEKGRALTREEMAQRMKIFNEQMAAQKEQMRQQHLMNLLGVVGLTPEHMEMAGLEDFADPRRRMDMRRFMRGFERSGMPFLPGQEQTQTGMPRFGSLEWQRMTGRKTGAKKWWEIGR